MSGAVAFIHARPQLSVPVPNRFRNAKQETKSATPAFPTPALASNFTKSPLILVVAYHKNHLLTMACKALFSINCSFTMECRVIVAEGLLMTTATTTKRKQRTRSDHRPRPLPSHLGLRSHPRLALRPKPNRPGPWSISPHPLAALEAVPNGAGNTSCRPAISGRHC